ncbi:MULTISPECIES: MerR family DNA-binding protein [Streptomyces]|uniref:MerR family DNA-binding protein n=1 Tax=Streptomyces TaxID=1883 RepID=UPI0037221793
MNDARRPMVIRRMKPLGFTLDELRDLLDITDRLDVAPPTDSTEHEALLERMGVYEQAAARKIEDLRTQLTRAEDFAATLRTRLRNAPGEETAARAAPAPA